MRRSHTYRTTVEVRALPNHGGGAATATVKHDGIRVTATPVVDADHDYAEASALATLAAIKRARRNYRALFGKAAP